jgi:hypothetical protein
MHGTFLANQKYKAPRICTVHGDLLVHDPIAGTLIYTVGDPTPLSLPAVVDRCPTCYPTVEALMKMAVPDFVKNLASASPGMVRVVEKLVVLWKDGRRDEYPITKG